MAVWFTSDLHLGHRAVAHQRKFGDWPEDKHAVTQEVVDWHDDMLARAWDSKVQTSDLVWVLGDLLISRAYLPEALNWIDARPGVKHLILGNHDPAHPMHREAHKYQKSYFRAFESVQMAARRKIHMPDGSTQQVLLSHYPYVGDGERHRDEDRDTQWRLSNEGLPILHGHTHTTEKVTVAAAPGGGPAALQIHVGLDAWGFAPVSLDEIVTVLDAPHQLEEIA
jgi:calcineurin-like phosphoesterase family protein